MRLDHISVKNRHVPQTKILKAENSKMGTLTDAIFEPVLTTNVVGKATEATII